MIIGLFSCSNNQKNLNKYISQLKTSINLKNHKQITPILIFQPPIPISYSSHPERSPFSTETPLNKVGSPLLVYPVSMLKFVGTLTKNGIIFAYVVAPDNKLYRVGIGDRMGDHEGVISRITSDRVDVIEKSTEAGENGAQRTVTLQLKDENK